ncbi:L-ribulose-5-phosphate 3-epimerase [Clostridium septicum]|uniref:L-ribulose-5-phosphate 3-epimerase n=1 Tax=Clostridium septicum TaxID=1504 RepID=A0A9N7JKH7_CLOSE|nr:L-ribulose-5-phosphate 3-epimerase [Clostridium septicum]AYE33919.1 L-ribulose-5-phosphate 4-epimerase [Clostridium septicum]MDU1312930.1 L-ribulose-5-phosphate 3-epimerase [Clostridium septicum]QAS62070.1 L-ribulose-5-phosphate 3-epimerase [Clostridium septicum]UEC21473.1 L-ribulose-5-phosphate 3-epimerase [Clostridium septicum]USS00480.1 L-ribulose-5-phosphate 3-epimerase [Clostridium septicum]
MKEYTLGLYEKSMPNTLTWKEKLTCAKEAGFDFVEISIDETEEKLSRLCMSKEERFELVKTMCEVGIPIRTMCLSGHRKFPLGSLDESVRNRGMEIMEKAVELACDLGIRIIQLAGYDVYYDESTEETKKLFAKNLKIAVEMAAKKGIILAFETMETEFMNTVEKAMKYVNNVNSPYLQVYPDCGNITNAAVAYNKNVLDDLKTGKGHIAAVHLKETVPGKFREIPFGTGHVNFEDIIKTSWDLGVRRYVAEFWYVGNDNWKETLKETKSFMDEKFKKAHTPN